MQFIVYILFSEKNNKHYTGFTANLEQRMISHNKLGKDWTARYRPWRIIFKKIFEDRSQAMKFEKWLKTGAGRDFVKSLPH